MPDVLITHASQIGACPSIPELMGSSSSSERARRGTAEASQRNRPVMISAEDGLDAVVVARAIHDASSRASGPFITVDCASPEAGSLDQKLFGLPTSPNAGGLEQLAENSLLGLAWGGTLVIGNLTELPSQLQGRLARALRDRQVHKLPEGASPLDVLLIGTVRDNLEGHIREGKIGRDLCSRFTLTFELPALRHRPADIPILIGCVVAEAAAAASVDVPTFSREALSLLSALPWRRNFDELREVLDVLVRVAAGGAIQLDDVLGHVPIDRLVPQQRQGASLREARNAFEREYIAAILSRHGWRMQEAARTLGIQRTNLYRKVRQLGIPRARAK
jgi:DNA-binding NtrC family response regulator